MEPLPASGRTYTRSRPVRLGDVSPEGRLRLDALARYLQDVANDDGTEVIGAEAMPWVVRRTELEVARFPVFQEHLTLVTWASGAGSRWAERRTSIGGERGALVEAVALWVHIDLDSGRPKKLSPSFWEHYGDATAGRQVAARLRQGDPPAGAPRVTWPVRRADFDLLGHVNNAIYWAMVEEHLDVSAPGRFELEYRGGIDPHQAVELVVDEPAGQLWALAAGTVAASAHLRPHAN